MNTIPFATWPTSSPTTTSFSTDYLELAPNSIADRLAIADLARWYARDRNMVLDVLRALGRVA